MGIFERRHCLGYNISTGCTPYVCNYHESTQNYTSSQKTLLYPSLTTWIQAYHPNHKVQASIKSSSIHALPPSTPSCTPLSTCTSYPTSGPIAAQVDLSPALGNWTSMQQHAHLWTRYDKAPQHAYKCASPYITQGGEFLILAAHCRIQ